LHVAVCLMLTFVILFLSLMELWCEPQPKHDARVLPRNSFLQFLSVEGNDRRALINFRPLRQFPSVHTSAGHQRSSSRYLLESNLPDRMRDRLVGVGMSATKGNLTRRAVAKGAIGILGAEAGWRQAVASARAMEAAGMLIGSGILPDGAAQQIEAGRAVVIKNWLPSDMSAALLADAKACFEAGHFVKVKTNIYRGKTDAETAKLNNRWFMNNIVYKKLGVPEDGPFVDPTIGDISLRQKIRDRLAQVKVLLASQLKDRPTLVDDNLEKSHELAYSRYYPGAFLQRHVDEKHIELKTPGGGKAKKRRNASRRSISYIVYLNDDWNAEDGGELRVHDRAQESISRVGARGPDLQIGWLRATADKNEQPVFLDSTLLGDDNCMLYTVGLEGAKRNLSGTPFANGALYLPGGDKIARPFMIDDPADAGRFHLTDCPKSPLKQINPSYGDTGEDGGERIQDIVPLKGTLVLFDSVAIPHEVRVTSRDRWTVGGWFHEKFYDAA